MSWDVVHFAFALNVYMSLKTCVMVRYVCGLWLFMIYIWPRPLTWVNGGELDEILLHNIIVESECSTQTAYFGKWWGT